MSERLQRMPNIRLEYLKALGTLTRRPKGEIRLVDRRLSLDGVRADPAGLAAYRQVCGFVDRGSLPVTYPQVLAAPIQIRLMAQPGFPLPLLGLVHVRNDIVQHRPIAAEEACNVVVEVGGARQTDRGFEFELRTLFRSDGGEEVWRAVATILYRNRRAERGSRKAADESEARAAEYLPLDVAEDLGRRYGRISGDINPIHLRPWTARLFGFPRHIAHGMWSLARCAALLETRSLQKHLERVEVQFRQPLFLPGKVAIKHFDDAGVTKFSLVNRESGKTHLSGSLR